jgi:hypothetical protein
LSDYAIYLWDCDRESEYILCGVADSDSHGEGAARQCAAPLVPYRRLAPTCYAGRYPDLRLDIYATETGAPAAKLARIMARMLLPRGLCAAIYQPADAAAPDDSRFTAHQNNSKLTWGLRATTMQA